MWENLKLHHNNSPLNNTSNLTQGVSNFNTWCPLRFIVEVYKRNVKEKKINLKKKTIDSNFVFLLSEEGGRKEHGIAKLKPY